MEGVADDKAFHARDGVYRDDRRASRGRNVFTTEHEAARCAFGKSEIGSTRIREERSLAGPGRIDEVRTTRDQQPKRVAAPGGGRSGRLTGIGFSACTVPTARSSDVRRLVAADGEHQRARPQARDGARRRMGRWPPHSSRSASCSRFDCGLIPTSTTIRRVELVDQPRSVGSGARGPSSIPRRRMVSRDDECTLTAAALSRPIDLSSRTRRPCDSTRVCRSTTAAVLAARIGHPIRPARYPLRRSGVACSTRTR